MLFFFLIQRRQEHNLEEKHQRPGDSKESHDALHIAFHLALSHKTVQVKHIELMDFFFFFFSPKQFFFSNAFWIFPVFVASQCCFFTLYTARLILSVLRQACADVQGSQHWCQV